MSVLKTAIKTQRWDLAAYALVLATTRILIAGNHRGLPQPSGGLPDDRKEAQNDGQKTNLTQEEKVCCSTQ